MSEPEFGAPQPPTQPLPSLAAAKPPRSTAQTCLIAALIGVLLVFGAIVLLVGLCLGIMNAR